MAVIANTTTNTGTSYSVTVLNAGALLVFAISTAAGESSVTFNGVAATNISSISNSCAASLYYMQNPPTGTHTFSFSGSNVNSCVYEITGADTGVPTGDLETQTASGQDPLVTMHPQGSSGVYITCCSAGIDGTFISLSPHQGQTAVYNANANPFAYASAYLLFTSNSNQALGYAVFNASSTIGAIIGVEIKDAPLPATGGGFFMAMLQS